MKKTAKKIPIQQSKTDLENHLKEQLGFLIRSCREYDDGETSEAKRLALTLRVLLHDTRTSKSLFKQLRLKDIAFVNSAFDFYVAKPTDPFLGLVKTTLSVHLLPGNMIEGKHHPLLNERPTKRKARKRLFPEWWNQIILSDMFGAQFSRFELICSVADTDGGAHIDPALDEKYSRLSRENSTGFAVGFNDDIKPIVQVELASIRQIAHEVLWTIKERHPEFLPEKPNYLHFESPFA